MELNGEVLVAAPRDRVWAGLNDTEVLRRCIPGCESMEATGEHERSATVAIKVGPVRARFSGKVRMDEVRPGEGCTLHFEGQGGAAGMARGSSRVALSDASGGTRLHYQTQASVAGKLGQVGGRMIDAAARQMADQFFAAFQAEVGTAPAEAASGAAVAGDGAIEPAASAPEPTAAAVAAPAPAPAPTGPASAPLPHPAAAIPSRPAPAAPTSESSRVLWFLLGSLSTGFGVWLARTLFG